MEITKEIIDKLNTTIDAGLVRGMGIPMPGKMCVEAAVCYALGLPHSDDPKCVNYALRDLKILLNDSIIWDSNKSRAEGLRRIAVAQLGTNEWTEEQEKQFLEQVTTLLINKFKPYSDSKEWDEWADKWLSGDRNVETADELVYSLNKKGINSYLVNLVSSSICEYPFNSSSFIFFSINDFSFLYGQEHLVDFCEQVVQILIKMETPGSKWL